MRDLKQYGIECIQELNSYGIDTSKLPKNIEWKVSRAKSRFGQCRYYNRNKCEINISKFMLDEDVLVDDHHLRDTIIHELLHALTPKCGHKGEWKRLARKVNVNSHGKYNIQRCGNYKEMGIDTDTLLDKRKIKYIVKCKQCGKEYQHIRRSKSVVHPEFFRCGKCKGPLESYKI